MKGKHVLITGHTGFKGSWLVAVLHSRGAKVSGIALDPVHGGIFTSAELGELLENDIRQDIRDGEKLTQAFQNIAPDAVVHLAAQPLVLASYDNPRETFETNVMGTLNVLQASEATPSVKAALVITTDKVYGQVSGEKRPFLEGDPLGAADPYSTSKAMADLLTQSWVPNTSDLRIAIARAGNVIGGGDVGSNRLVPDLMNFFVHGRTAVIRNPESVRPWQHVLDCLEGYFRLLQALLDDEVRSGAFNFGPDPTSSFTASDVADLASRAWGSGAKWITGHAIQPSEADYLALVSEKAKSMLGWTSSLTVLEAIEWTVAWHKELEEGISGREITLRQVMDFKKRLGL